ncbi:Photosystem I P700 chlorophyll a apoprotein A1 [Platanthera guangdongensis]|uniref:Photosystem I P700 chlorophyll a apoprotein A1 n=1 Tax=Platanthera guangdongensis TaxID=2320717 RepID=A0ABR2MTC6_9ASPA
MQPDVWGTISDQGVVTHITGGNFAQSSIIIKGWLRDFLWAQASQIRCVDFVYGGFSHNSHLILSILDLILCDKIVDISPYFSAWSCPSSVSISDDSVLGHQVISPDNTSHRAHLEQPFFCPVLGHRVTKPGRSPNLARQEPLQCSPTDLNTPQVPGRSTSNTSRKEYEAARTPFLRQIQNILNPRSFSSSELPRLTQSPRVILLNPKRHPDIMLFLITPPQSHSAYLSSCYGFSALPNLAGRHLVLGRQSSILP